MKAQKVKFSDTGPRCPLPQERRAARLPGCLRDFDRSFTPQTRRKPGDTPVTPKPQSTPETSPDISPETSPVTLRPTTTPKPTPFPEVMTLPFLSATLPESGDLVGGVQLPSYDASPSSPGPKRALVPPKIKLAQELVAELEVANPNG